MAFWISITLDRRNYSYWVEKQPSDSSFEYYNVIAANGVMVIKNNSPVFKRHNLKHRRPTWSVEKNGIWNVRLFELITQAIERHEGL